MEPIQFIGEPIDVEFDEKPALSKRPGLPARFVWRGDTCRVAQKLREWHDYGRRGRVARNMRQAHLEAARRRGSWGVGRDYYRVRTARGRVFDLYYDRAPRSADDRGGSWHLYRELEDRRPGSSGQADGDPAQDGESGTDPQRST